MLPYWLLFSIFAVGSLEYRRRGLIGSQSTPFLIVGGLVIALMVGLRYQVGGDWGNYEDILKDISFLELPEVLRSSDPGYAVLNWLANALGLEIWFVNTVCAVVFTWGLIKFARRQPNPWLAVMVAIPYLVIVVAMGYTRQGVAIGFILAGLSVVDRSSTLRFVFYIICAAAFHKSAVVVLPLVALASTQNRILTLGILIGTAVLLYYLFVVASIDKLMTNYVESEYASQGAGVRVAMNLPPALLFLLFQRRFQLSVQQKLLWRNFSIAALVALTILLFTEATTAVDRLALYLIPLQIFVLSRLPEAFPDRRKVNGQLALAVVAYSALIQFVWLNYAANAGSWLPYQLYPTPA